MKKSQIFINLQYVTADTCVFGPGWLAHSHRGFRSGRLHRHRFFSHVFCREVGSHMAEEDSWDGLDFRVNHVLPWSRRVIPFPGLCPLRKMSLACKFRCSRFLSTAYDVLGL